MFGGVFVFGVATLVFGVSTTFWISLLALTLLGAGDMVSVYIRHLLVQLETPDEIRGRVSAVNGVFIGASNELGRVRVRRRGCVVRRGSRRPHRWRRNAARGARSGRAYSRSCGAWTASRADRDNCISIQYPRSMRRADRKQVEKGRGAVNEPGRPIREHHARTGRRWLGQLAEPVPRVETTLIAEFPKHAITHNKSPDVPFEQSLNPYQGCEHGCIYCFARPAHAYLNLSPGLDFETRIFHKPRLAELLRERTLRAGLPVQGASRRRQHRSLSARRALAAFDTRGTRVVAGTAPPVDVDHQGQLDPARPRPAGAAGRAQTRRGLRQPHEPR